MKEEGDDLEDLQRRRQVMIEKLSDDLAAPVEEAYPMSCSRCAEGQHDRCNRDVYHPLAKSRTSCGCPMRGVAGHPD